jgi:hypothetical protein
MVQPSGQYYYLCILKPSKQDMDLLATKKKL